MYQQGGTIKQVLDKIASNQYVLPAIQREFVWTPEQICRLFDSIMQGYPVGEFLFWNIEPENSADYSYYGFILDYHQRNNSHSPDLGTLSNKRVMAVLDGQQRLTSFNIGLRGSMSIKTPYKQRKSPDAFPCRVLALDLLTKTERDEEGNCYAFEFVKKECIGRCHGKHLWFKVSDIINMEPYGMNNWLLDYNLEKQQYKDAFRVLYRLHQVIHTETTIAYYEETNQDIEHVLNIFIRRNSGGTILSYSDLLLSIATSQWKVLDARKEVHQLVDDLNKIGPSLELTKNFVLKAGLMLTDIARVGFQVRNFTKDNMAILEKNWQQIREALVETVRLVTGFGFDAKSIRATSALLPIAYYLYQIGSPKNFCSKAKYLDEHKAIRNWLIRTILKPSGIWGSGLDTLLTALREVLRNASDKHFPVAEIQHLMAQRGKSLNFSDEEIEDLADMGLKDKRIFALLALLSPFIDFQKNQFHIDHVFPQSHFTPSRLEANRIDNEQFDDLRDCADRIGNLQLLEGITNLEKQAMLPAEWIRKQYPDSKARQNYCDLHFLGDIPSSVTGFLEFYEARRKRLLCRINKLVNSL